MRIELTNEIIKAITMNCPLSKNDLATDCDKHCALAGACLEYWTGDDSYNKEEINNEIYKKRKNYFVSE